MWTDGLHGRAGFQKLNIRHFGPVLQRVSHGPDNIAPRLDIRRRRVQRCRERNDDRLGQPPSRNDTRTVTIFERVGADRRLHADERQQRNNRTQSFAGHRF